MPIQPLLMDSPIGVIRVTATENQISEVWFMDKDETGTIATASPGGPETPALLAMACIQQLQEYFSGQRRQFDLPIHQDGSPFQQRVWAQLTTIPYGRTISYLALSKQIGNVKAIRAAASANGCNAISILVPCHRVIGSNGSLTGYSGGLWRKKWLLQHEAKYAHGLQALF